MDGNMTTGVGVLSEESWNDLRCEICEMRLSVAPIGIVDDGTFVCGRCYGKFDDANSSNLVLRAASLEKFLSTIFIPCSYFNNGCKRMFRFNTSGDHEDVCAHKKYKCPSTPLNSCPWTDSGDKLKEHFLDKHKELVMSSGQCELQLDCDTETNRILTFLERLFLVQTKVDAKNNLLFVAVRFLGSPRHAEDFAYSFELSDATNHSQFVNAIHAPEKRIQTDHELKIDVERAVRVSITDILNAVGYSKSVSCSVKLVRGEQRRSNTPELPESMMMACKWSGCCELLSVKEYQKHLERCAHRTTACKWSGCGRSGRVEDVRRHHDVCDKRTLLCRWDDCQQLILHKDLDDHEDNCKKRLSSLYDCNFIDHVRGPCDCHLSFSDLIDHVKETHSDAVYENGEVERVEPIWSGNNWFMIVHGKLFRCRCNFACGIDGFKFAAVYYGTDKIASKYRLEVELVHPKDDGQNLTLHCDILSCFAKTKKFLHVDCKPVLPYVRSNSITFKFKIIC